MKTTKCFIVVYFFLGREAGQGLPLGHDLGVVVRVEEADEPALELESRLENRGLENQRPRFLLKNAPKGGEANVRHWMS